MTNGKGYPVPSEYRTNIAQINLILPKALLTCFKSRAINAQISWRIPTSRICGDCISRGTQHFPSRRLGKYCWGLQLYSVCYNYKCHARKITGSNKGPVALFRRVTLPKVLASVYLLIFSSLCTAFFMNINVASWWEVFVGLSELEEAVENHAH